jgi:hypothetical protein
MEEDGTWMFFVARLHGLSGEPNAVSYCHATIHELGFSRDWSSPLSSEPPPRDPRFDVWYMDRTFFAQSGKTRRASLASVAIDEARVYDQQLRSDIDCTGFRVSVTLPEDAFRLFVTFLVAAPSYEEYLGPLFAMRVPSKPFVFPAFRGNPDPSSGGEEYTRDLKAIGRLEPDEIAVAIVEKRVPNEEGPARIFAERYDVLSARKLFMTRDTAAS